MTRIQDFAVGWDLESLSFNSSVKDTKRVTTGTKRRCRMSSSCGLAKSEFRYKWEIRTEPVQVTWMQAPQPHFWGLPDADTELENPRAATCQYGQDVRGMAP